MDTWPFFRRTLRACAALATLVVSSASCHRDIQADAPSGAAAAPALPQTNRDLSAPPASMRVAIDRDGIHIENRLVATLSEASAADLMLPAVAAAIPADTHEAVIAATPDTKYGVLGHVAFTLALHGVAVLCIEAVHVDDEGSRIGCIRIEAPRRGPDNRPAPPSDLNVALYPDGFRILEGTDSSSRQPLSALATMAAQRRLPGGAGIAAILASREITMQTFVTAADALAPSFPHLQQGFM